MCHDIYWYSFNLKLANHNQHIVLEKQQINSNYTC